VTKRESDARTLLSRLLILPYKELTEPRFASSEAQVEHDKLRADILAFLERPL
jgi:hypothetical protein